MLKCVYRKKDCVSLLVHICCVYTHIHICGSRRRAGGFAHQMIQHFMDKIHVL